MIKTSLNPVLDKQKSILDLSYKVNNDFIDFIEENNIDVYYIAFGEYKLKILNFKSGYISRLVAVYSSFVIFTNEELAMYVKIKFEEFVLNQVEQGKDEDYNY